MIKLVNFVYYSRLYNWIIKIFILVKIIMIVLKYLIDFEVFWVVFVGGFEFGIVRIVGWRGYSGLGNILGVVIVWIDSFLGCLYIS